MEENCHKDSHKRMSFSAFTTFLQPKTNCNSKVMKEKHTDLIFSSGLVCRCGSGVLSPSLPIPFPSLPLLPLSFLQEVLPLFESLFSLLLCLLHLQPTQLFFRCLSLSLFPL